MIYKSRSLRRSALACAALLSLSQFCLLAFAQEGGGASKTTFERPRPTSDYNPSIGLRSGFADTDGSNYGGGTEYGIEAGFEPYIPFGLALELSGYVSDPSGDLPTLTRTKLLGKGLYNLGGRTPVIRDSYVGLGIGPVWDNVANDTSVEFGLAPLLGFDIPLAGWASDFSLGANANYLFVGGAKPDVFATNAMVKYWF